MDQQYQLRYLGKILNQTYGRHSLKSTFDIQHSNHLRTNKETLYGVPRAKSDTSLKTIEDYNNSLDNVKQQLEFRNNKQMKALKYTMNSKFLQSMTNFKKNAIKAKKNEEKFELSPITLKHRHMRNYSVKGTVHKRQYSFEIFTKEPGKSWIQNTNKYRDPKFTEDRIKSYVLKRKQARSVALMEMKQHMDLYHSDKDDGDIDDGHCSHNHDIPILTDSVIEQSPFECVKAETYVNPKSILNKKQHKVSIRLKKKFVDSVNNVPNQVKGSKAKRVKIFDTNKLARLVTKTQNLRDKLNGELKEIENQINYH